MTFTPRRMLLTAGIAAAALAVLAGATVAVYQLADRGPALTAATAPATSAAPSDTSSPEPRPSPTPKTYTAFGSIVLKGAQIRTGTNCEGDIGYTDLRGGSTLRILDKGGNAVATARLEAGLVNGATCVFQFTAPGIPPGAGPYQLSIALREGPTLQESEIARGSAIYLEVG